MGASKLHGLKGWNGASEQSSKYPNRRKTGKGKRSGKKKKKKTRMICYSKFQRSMRGAMAFIAMTLGNFVSFHCSVVDSIGDICHPDRLDLMLFTMGWIEIILSWWTYNIILTLHICIASCIDHLYHVEHILCEPWLLFLWLTEPMDYRIYIYSHPLNLICPSSNTRQILSIPSLMCYFLPFSSDKELL
ncbi:hypothetical protein ASPWEDRAFT_487829 [Aspergillus wentii DTO 134E9]|uniref:Uncharacterized protein n=1 Tax=Aspergillus wentii DTO 134E9 TaxID=1073089 RepID=A0A1L9RJB7_ASPWE|nr:uncharacterized protein ASPWEDRAFT_487829 [Aspergillus wentii DTO 134E9]OJJ34991.1 hypothetical protein ASPWEDRAFT_487829 [Aspergillus wentii DTO 134E9]